MERFFDLIESIKDIKSLSAIMFCWNWTKIKPDKTSAFICFQTVWHFDRCSIPEWSFWKRSFLKNNQRRQKTFKISKHAS